MTERRTGTRGAARRDHVPPKQGPRPTLILTMREFDIKRFFTLDDFYDSDRAAYYAVLKRVNESYPDCTPWLDYFLEGVELSLHRVKERVLLLSSDEHRKVAGGQVALSERQMRVIEFIHANGSVKSGDLISCSVRGLSRSSHGVICMASPARLPARSLPV